MTRRKSFGSMVHINVTWCQKIHMWRPLRNRLDCGLFASQMLWIFLEGQFLLRYAKQIFMTVDGKSFVAAAAA
jgi:hypothetical protein